MKKLDMKLHLPSLLRMAVLACMACSAPLYATTYTVEGVVIKEIKDIDQDYIDDVILDSQKTYSFYDGGKGSYWTSSTISPQVEQLFQQNGNSYSFLGEAIGSYLPDDATSYSKEHFALLKEDGLNCWAYTSGNVIQYWQNYYGVFASDPSKLAHGHTYTENLDKLAGTQSLNINMEFYKNWNSGGGQVQTALGWYLGGVNDYSSMKDPSAEAPGHFKEYFPYATWTEGCDKSVSIYSETSLAEFSKGITEGLGYEKQADNTYKQTTKGQVLYLALWSSSSGHAVTCYGFEADANGNVTSLYITNSDDEKYRLEKVDIKQTDDGYLLYFPGGIMTWTFGSSSKWQIASISSIDTPQVLKDMLAEYSDTTKPLYWNGHATTWDTTAGDMTEVIPGDATGWVAKAGTDYYASYYDKTRAVIFDDSATGSNRSISLTGDVSAASVTVDNSDSDYSFSGAYSISADLFTKSGTKKAIFTGVTLNTPTTTISGGSLEMGAGSTLKGTSATVQSGGSLHFNGGKANLSGNLTLENGSALTLANGTAITAGSISCAAGSSVSMGLNAADTASPALTLTGALSLGSAGLEIDFGSTYIQNTSTYTLATATGGITLDSLTSFTVTGDSYSADRYSSKLEHSTDGKTLTLVVTKFQGEVIEWTGSGSAGENTNWSGNQAPGPSDTAVLNGGGSSTIDISGSTSVGMMVVNSPEKDYEFTGNGTMMTGEMNVNEGKITVSNSRTEVAGALVVGKDGEIAVSEGSVLAVGGGSKLGTVGGGGSFEINGNTSANSISTMQNLTINSNASLEVTEAATVNGQYSSSANGSFSSATGITFASKVSAGGHVAAPHITVTGTGNSFTTLSAGKLTVKGTLDADTPVVSVNTFVPQGAGYNLTPQADSPVSIEVEDATAAANTYGIIETQTGIDGSSFTLDAATVRAFRRNEMDAFLSDDGTTLSLNLVHNAAGYYERAAETENGRTAARLLDEVWLSDASEAGNADLDALFADLTDFRDTGNGQKLDEVAAAAAGASIPALGIAYAGDVTRQLRAIRNRMTTMGVDSRYEHPQMPYINAWINAEGDYRQLEDDGTAAGFTLSSWGGTVGMDMDTTENLTLGLACSALYGDFEASGADMAEGDLDTYYASLFARVASGSWVHSFVMTAGMADISLDRTVNHGSGSYTTQGSTEGTSWGLQYELAYTISATEDESICWQPVINVTYVHAAIDAYTETGSDAALTAGEQEFDQLSFGAGARMQAIISENLYERHSILELRALLKADVGDREGEADLGFAALPGTAATLKSNDYGAVGVELGAAITVPLSADSGELFLDVSADLRDGYNEVNGAAGWRLHF